MVATLWAIDDEGATAFTEAFYTALREEPPVRALATAKQAMMLHDRYSHPFYWAGYRITTRRPEVAQNQVAMSVSQ